MKHYTFENAAVELAGADATREFLEPIFNERSVEILVVALCDEKVRLIQLLSVAGALDEVAIPLVRIMREAVLTVCAGLIVAHNHPSGDTWPSAADISLTKRLALATESLDIALLDHLIFANGPPFSFRRAGLI